MKFAGIFISLRFHESGLCIFLCGKLFGCGQARGFAFALVFVWSRILDDFQFSPENGDEFCLQIGGILGEVLEQCDLGDDIAEFGDRVKIFGFLPL